jgi:hypothetical protein
LKGKACKKMKQAEVLIKVGDYIVKHGCIKGALARMMVSDILSEEELQRINGFVTFISAIPILSLAER